MESLFLGCLVGGILFAIVSVVLGDWLSASLDGMLDFLSLDGHPILQPMAIVGGITVFGGSGLLLDRHTEMNTAIVLLLSIICAVAAAIGVYYFYVRPMQKTENSTGYSMKELTGAIGEVSVPIPAIGYGEVLIRVGAGLTSHIASSHDGVLIPNGSRVVVINVEGHSLVVSLLEL
ncbi:NfeD family protein [Paenibacillus sp. CF384]|uniref:NfeD family protein n=1 Tax=Paenibacillus sp. CF384 TaxID=1884382 RepID=UPI00089A50EF|nr:NfeD family protein [Paenibacillus sp. CF384]SDW58722.1 NfeD-like C-terminal, partner-binding [Paenibacillus sp. CF384]